MIKFKVTPEELAELPAEIQALYENGKLLIETPPVAPELEGLQANNAAILEEKRALKAKLQTLENQNTQAEQDTLKSQGRFDELLLAKTKEFETKLNEAHESEHSAIELLKSTKLDAAISELALSLSDNAMLIEPHLRARLRVTDTGEVEVLDSTGELSAMKIPALREEFENSETFAPLLKLRGSAGAGAKTPENNGTDNSIYFDPESQDYSYEKQEQIKKESPELFKELSKKYNEDIFDTFARGQSKIREGRAQAKRRQI